MLSDCIGTLSTSVNRQWQFGNIIGRFRRCECFNKNVLLHARIFKVMSGGFQIAEDNGAGSSELDFDGWIELATAMDGRRMWIGGCEELIGGW